MTQWTFKLLWVYKELIINPSPPFNATCTAAAFKIFRRGIEGSLGNNKHISWGIKGFRARQREIGWLNSVPKDM